MDPKEIANLYYDAWIHRAGDMTEVPPAAEFSFRGPVASFDDAAGFRQMAAQAGAAVPQLPRGTSSPTAMWCAQWWIGNGAGRRLADRSGILEIRTGRSSGAS
jgi:hypothetical protein